MKRILCFLFALTVILATSVSAFAVDYGCDVNTVSKAIYLENLDTGAVVYQKSAQERMYPASTTKIMTYVVVVEHVSDYDNTMVTIKEELLTGLDPDSTVMGLKDHVGEQYSVRDLLYGMMLPSGNDAALVLADYVGNGISGFVEMMNAKAVELGCTDTHFANPHGLFDSNHYSTAKDMATISKYACTLPGFMTITNTVSYTPARFDQPVTNTNYMLINDSEHAMYYYPYTKGIKTGYLDEAGKCLVTTAEKDGFHYLCVALGAEYSFTEDVNYAMLDTASLYEWSFTNVGYQTLYGPTEVVKSVEIQYGKGEKNLNLIPEGELKALLPNRYDQNLVRVEVDCEDRFEAPITKGQALGKATVYYDDMTVGTTNIVAANDVELDEMQRFFANMSEWLRTHMLLVIGIILVIILLIILLIVISKAQKKKAAQARYRRRYRD